MYKRLAVFMDPTNSRGRSKFLACFKPFVDGDDETGRDSASPPSSGDESGGRRKKRGRRSFSVAMKAVFCKTSPVSILKPQRLNFYF